MRKWTTKDYRTMPWKNGGGSTTELAIFPEGASLDHFFWRLSTASVTQPGPFSHFAQIDRTLAILLGDGLVLKRNPSLANEDIHLLQKTSTPFSFSGEDAIYAELCGGSVLDLNLMTRRDVCQHYMQRLYAGEHAVDFEHAQQILVYCAQGGAQMDEGTVLETGDLLLLEEEHAQQGISLQLQVDEDSIVYLMRISFLNNIEMTGGTHGLE